MNRNQPNPVLLSLYRRALCLYPSHLRSHYQDQILLTVHDAHSDYRSIPLRFWLRIFADLLQSSLKERLLMANDRILARPILCHAVTLGLILTVFGFAAAITLHQMIRRGANQPQAQMADFYAAQITSSLASGANPSDTIPGGHVDLQRNLEPFVILYDDHTRPIASNGYLNQTVPKPPPGVFNYARAHTTNTLTWQPQPDVRIAAVIRHIPGPNPSFILTGRSLRIVEDQENLLTRMVFTGWFCVIALLFAGALFLGRAQRHRPA